LRLTPDRCFHSAFSWCDPDDAVGRARERFPQHGRYRRRAVPHEFVLTAGSATQMFPQFQTELKMQKRQYLAIPLKDIVVGFELQNAT
jgi:hypothetical protein